VVLTTPHFDAENVFGDDYLYFFAGHLEERNYAETDLIWRLLELRPGMEVLDLACGHGRIANRLAQRGCRVTGLDTTELFLDRARPDAAERGVRLGVRPRRHAPAALAGPVRRDHRLVRGVRHFDDPGNQQVFSQASAALRPGGRLGWR
jgi:cyclopropane fatty-acyl-phospholipid synthase-like methyltransferase